MRLPKLFALVNAFVAVIILLTLAAMHHSDPDITSAMIAEAAKKTNPSFGLDLLSQSASVWQHRSHVYEWLCCGALALVALNAFGWAIWYEGVPIRRSGTSITE